MENKYYVPTIDEFHVGFEFDVNDTIRDGSGRKEWSYNVKFSTAIANYIKWILDKSPEDIKVKYLDREDIESLGWKYAQYLDRTTICLNFERKNDWYLNYWFGETPFIEISRDGYDTGFTGYIKNKSELVKLMKQLNIK